MTASVAVRMSGVAAILCFSVAGSAFTRAELRGKSILAQRAVNPRPSPRSRAGAPRPQACTSCQEQRPTLDPGLFSRGYDAEVKPGYEVARKYPSILDRIHCFCECRESSVFKHKTLLSCFTETHAAGCGICLKEATLAGQLKESGYSDDHVARKIEATFRTEGHPPIR